MIDDIYHEETIKFNDDIKLIHDDVKEWIDKNKEPLNINATIITKWNQIEKKLKKEEELK